MSTPAQQIQMSPLLKQFYVDIDTWIKSDFNVQYSCGFSLGFGLCSNLARWCNFKKFNNDIKRKLKIEQEILFIEHYKTPSYPFNTEYRQYDSEAWFKRTFTNPARLAWIKLCVESSQTSQSNHE